MKYLNEDEIFEIPMTSLIDIVFLLLIFFLVATNFIKKEIDQQIIIPESAGAEKKAEPIDKLIINVRENELIIVNGQIVSETELKKIIKEFKEKKSDPRAIVRGDARVSYQAVMRVFGICKSLGIKKVDLPVSEPKIEG